MSDIYISSLSVFNTYTHGLKNKNSSLKKLSSVSYELLLILSIINILISLRWINQVKKKKIPVKNILV